MAKLLSFAVNENHFVFIDTVYNQHNGIAMGSQLGPVLANIFMARLIWNLCLCSHSQGTNQLCTVAIWMISSWHFNLYKDDVNGFFQWMNDQHQQIKCKLSLSWCKKVCLGGRN